MAQTRRSGSTSNELLRRSDIYLADGIGRHEKQLRQFGPHATGVGCLYITDLDKIDTQYSKALLLSRTAP